MGKWKGKKIDSTLFILYHQQYQIMLAVCEIELNTRIFEIIQKLTQFKIFFSSTNLIFVLYMIFFVYPLFINLLFIINIVTAHLNLKPV